MSNKITVTTHKQADHTIFVDEASGIPYVNRAQLEKIFTRVSSGTLSRRLEGVPISLLKSATIQTVGGLQGVPKLYPPSVVFELALEFDWPLAKTMGAAGAAIYVYGLAGYQVKAEESESPIKLPTEKELAYMLIAAIDAKEEAQAVNESLIAQIEAEAPATALGSVIIDSRSQNIRIGDFAKVLGIGQQKYFEELRECKIIMSGEKKTLPYQRYIDARYFRVTEVQGTGGVADKWFPVCLITPKGQAYLAKRHRDFVSKSSSLRVIDVESIAIV